MLFVGDSGTAKTVVIQKYFSTLPNTEWLILAMNFSSRTTSMDVQRMIEDAVEKRTKVFFLHTPLMNQFTIHIFKNLTPEKKRKKKKTKLNVSSIP